MFLGEYSPNITSGNRIALPKKHREQLAAETVVLSKGFEKCILVYDRKDWSERVERQVDNLATEGVKRSNLERYLYTSAEEATVDSQGRVVVPSDLKKYAGIEGKTATIGVGDHIEIWDEKAWKEHLKKISEKLPE